MIFNIINSISFKENESKSSILNGLVFGYWTLSIFLNFLSTMFMENWEILIIFNLILVFIYYASSLVLKNVALYFFRAFFLLFMIFIPFLIISVLMFEWLYGLKYIYMYLLFIFFIFLYDLIGLFKGDNYINIYNVVKNSFNSNTIFSKDRCENLKHKMLLKDNLIKKIFLIVCIPLIAFALIFGNKAAYVFSVLAGFSEISNILFIAFISSIFVFVYCLTYINLYLIFFIVFIKIAKKNQTEMLDK
jgi:hypothetical protein